MSDSNLATLDDVLVRVQRGDLDAVATHLDAVGRAPVPTRKAKQRSAATEVTDAHVETVSGAVEALGESPVPDPERPLQPAEVDTLAGELIAVRDAQDVLKGRHDTLREYGITAIRAQMKSDGIEDYETQSGEIVSEFYDQRLTLSIAGGKPTVNWDRLHEVVDESIWHQVTDLVVESKTVYKDFNEKTGEFYARPKIIDQEKTEYRQINEDRLKRAIDDGTITLEQIEQIVERTPMQERFSVKPVKKEE